MTFYYPVSTSSRRTSSPPKCRWLSAGGFSLVELLSVIAVLAVLVCLLVPVISSMRIRASSTTSASNLRAIGVAMHMYMQEHQGYLPGPIINGQRPFYGTHPSLDRNLPNFLYPYMGLPEPTQRTMLMEAFTFPEYLTHDPNMTGPVYFATSSLTFGGRRKNPWGYASSDPAKVGSPSML
ncbi:MAG: type II secretion system protein, partial [Puniceicoccales bacterium]